jgi:hypothetical protein
MSLSSSVISFFFSFWALRFSLRVLPDSLCIRLSTLLRMLLPFEVDIERNHPLKGFNGACEENKKLSSLGILA